LFCSHCGAAADNRQKYCSACGAVLAEPQVPQVPSPNIPSRRRLYLAAGIAAALLWFVAAWLGWVWLSLIAGSVLIWGTIVLLVIAVVKYARRHWGKRTVSVSSACLVLFVLAVLSLKFGPGLLSHSHADSRVVIYRTAASVGVVRAGAFSPDGRILATGDERGVHSWDSTTWRELGFVATPFPVNAVVFSPDSSKLAVLGDARIDVLNMQNGEMSGRFEGRADAAAFSVDSMNLQVYSQENSKASLATWELSSGRRSETFAGPASHSMPAFSTDGMKIAWDDNSGLIKIRDPRTGTEIISLSVPGYTSFENLRLELSPDGKKIAVLGVESNVVVLDATMDATVHGRIVQTVSCDVPALAMAFSPDGSRIALACDSASTSRGTARVFEISSGKLLFDFQDNFNTGKPVWIRFSPDGSKLATPDNIWDTRSAPELQRGDAPEPVTLDFAADSSKIFGAGRGAGSEWTMTAATVRTWNTSDGLEIGRFTIPTTYPGNEVSAFSPDHSKVLLASRGGKGGVAQVYSMADGKLLYELPDNGWPSLTDGPFRDDVESAEFSPDGSRIVTGEEGGGNHSHLGYIWDAQTGRRLYDLRSGNHYGFGGRFSPDSRTLIAEIDRDILAAWDVGSGKLIYRLTGMPNAHGLKLTADGNSILLFMREEDPSNIAECSVQVRDAATGLLRQTIRFRLRDVSALTSAGHIRYLAHDFSPDGSELIVAGQDNGTAHILSTATGGLVRHFEGHVGPVNSVAFSPSGSMVLTAGEDHTVRLWSREDGRLLHILEGHQGPVQRAFFSPDGSHVIAYTDNNRIWLWDAKSGLGRQLQ